MPGGKIHFKSNVVGGAVLLGMAAWGGADVSSLWAVTGGALAGTLVTPDYDLNKGMPRNILTMFPPWRWIWWPYRKLVKHRSWVSHGPLVGTAIRILYLLLWILVLGIAAAAMGFDSAPLLSLIPYDFLLLGLFLGAWTFQDLIHIFLDYFF